MAFKEVYQSGHGWVRQFPDGLIIGPFESPDLAAAAKRPEVKKEKEQLAEDVEQPSGGKSQRK
jgi:hypothetical protein